jgi:hypothetical protein
MGQSLQTRGILKMSGFSKSCRELFEQELNRRGVAFARDADSGRYEVKRADGTRLQISLENLCREFYRDNDPAHIARFIDTALSVRRIAKLWAEAERGLYLNLEPSDYADRSVLASTISGHVDSVPVLFDRNTGLITWVTLGMLRDWSVDVDALNRGAGVNLDEELRTATLEFHEFDAVQLGFINSLLPFKASLVLAPNFRSFAEPILGWPLLAVAPARDFLFVWNARHREFINRLGSVVVKEYKTSPYPLSTEVFELTDQGMRAIGAFQADA